MSRLSCFWVSNLWFFFGVLLVGLGSLTTGCQGETVLTADQVEDVIRKDIPLGSKASEVLIFLDLRRFGTHRFDHTSYVVDPDIISRQTRYGSDEKARALAGRLHGFIGAALHETRRGFATTSSIVVTFYFDKDDELIDFTVKEVVGK